VSIVRSGSAGDGGEGMAATVELPCAPADRERTPDEELIAALAHDLPAHFESLVLAYQDRLYAFALRLTANPQDAEEVAQDAFVRAFHALRGYASERVETLALRPWLYQIALNIVRNRRRGKRPENVRLPGDDEGSIPELAAADDERPESVWERTERDGELAALVRALPERYRTAIVLRHVEGMTYPEAALVLEQPVGTVKANVHRGMLLLRAAVKTRVQEGILDGHS